MAVYVVAQARVRDRKLLEEYLEKGRPTLEGHEARIVAYDETPEIIEGTVETPRTVIMEFPSHDAFRAWYDSPEYQAVLSLRLRAAPGTMVVAKGFVPPAAD